MFSCGSDPHFPPNSGVDNRKAEKFPVLFKPVETVDCAKESDATVAAEVGVRTDMLPNTSARFVELVDTTGALEATGAGTGDPNRSVFGLIAVATAGFVFIFIISNNALLLLEDDGAVVEGADSISNSPPEGAAAPTAL